MAARLLILAEIHQRDGVVKVLILAFEGGGATGQLLIAIVEIQARTVCQFLGAAGNNLLHERPGFFEFVLLHELESSLIVLHSLCKSRILRGLGFRGSGRWFLLRHGFCTSKCLSFVWFRA